MAAASAVSAGLGVVQTVSGLIGARKDRKAIENFNRQELTNPFENLAVSTLQSEQETDANLSRFATSIDALQRGGTRAVAGALPRLSEGNILLNNIISKDLTAQDTNLNLLIAKGESDVRGIREAREVNALQGLGQSLQTNRQDAMSGIENIIQSGLAFASAKEANDDDETGTTA